MALVHIPIENELHSRIRRRMQEMTKAGKKTTWESLFQEWGKAWLKEADAPMEESQVGASTDA